MILILSILVVNETPAILNHSRCILEFQKTEKLSLSCILVRCSRTQK